MAGLFAALSVTGMDLRLLGLARHTGTRLPFVRSLGLVKGNVSVADVVDMSFARAAVAELGPYKKRAG